MIDLGYRRETAGAVATLAGIGSADVLGRQANGAAAVMAADAVAGNATVVEYRAGPTAGGMAVNAGIA